MSDSTTIARPYAKAIFEQALAEGKLANWSDSLTVLTQAILDSQVMAFVANPASTDTQKIELLESICNAQLKNDESLSRLIALLIANKRVMLIPDIKVLYEIHRADQEKMIEVDVFSFSTLSSAQEKQLVESLSKRLNRKVSLKVSLDSSLLGGAVIQAGNLVMDGSVRGKLKKLGISLAA